MRNGSRPVVMVVRTVGSDHREPLRRLVAGLALPESADSVAVKVNMCDYRRPETGVVCDPQVLDALLRVLRDRYPRARLAVCEQDATPTVVRNLWDYLGVRAVAARYDAHCVSLSSEEWISVPIRGRRHARLEVPRLLHEADVVINHPKLKTHGKTKLTCGLKNLFGCYRQKDKRPLHRFLDDAIVDINLALPTTCTIVDANLCVEGNRGPAQGFPKRLGLFIGGRDRVAVDAFCARLMGFNPYLVHHVRKAAVSGLGSMRWQLVGDLEPSDLAACRFRFDRKKFLLMQVARKVLSWSEAG